MVPKISSCLHIPQVLMAAFSYLTQSLISFASIFLPGSYVKSLRIFFKTLPRDLRAVYSGALIMFEHWNDQRANHNVLTKFSRLVKKHPSKVCFYFQSDTWTFSEVDEWSNKIAIVFHAAGFRKGDVIALMMTNRPEFACIWLGLAKIGVVSAFINTSLSQNPLIHCIEIANCKGVIFSDDLTSVVKDVKSSLKPDMRLYQWGGEVKDMDIFSLHKMLSKVHHSESPPLCEVSYTDHLIYIYTSGTTGLPKAAITPHSRVLNLCLLVKYLVKLRPDDVLYNPLPLYHTAGGMLGIGTSLLLGSSCVIRSKFSASSYIPDCIKYKCTVGQYIGEVCRYILAVPPRLDDKAHYLRAIVGNGLRPAVWVKFLERFGIKNVLEVYGSTEGNLQFVNTDGTVGAVGFIPRFFPFSRYIGVIVKFDVDTETILRNSDGFCIPCEIGEPGMFVGIIPWKESIKDVHGYLDKKETSKKFIRNVLKKGDKAFVSGDLMVMDEMGYLYFRDRTGDTFRWKGENVSTSEVEAIMSSIIGLRDCIVYGVQVGDLEGRIGMAAIADPKEEIDMTNLVQGLDKMLPKFAHPIFIRIIPKIEMTSTFKLKKINFQREGFNPEVVKDKLYFRHGPFYVPLTKEIYDEILSGKINL